MPRRTGPATLLCREGIEIKGRISSIDASAPTRYFQWGLRGLVVAYGYEIAEDLVADVCPLLDYFLGRRPVRIADLASPENAPAAPPSFDIFDAFEGLCQLSRLLIDYVSAILPRAQAVSRMPSAIAALRMCCQRRVAAGTRWRMRDLQRRKFRSSSWPRQYRLADPVLFNPSIGRHRPLMPR